MRSRAALLGLLAAPVALAQGGHEEGAPHDEPAPLASAPAPSASGGAPQARVRVPEKDGMLRVPGGRFVMGADDKGAAPNERPRRTASVPAFYIDKTEVTVGAYARCVAARACERPRPSSSRCTFDLGDPELPVSCVRWQDALAYCRFARKRLPREPEWELTARGASANAYPWGGGASTCFHAATLLRDTSGRSCTQRPSRVGSRPAGASPFGALDMSGNVEEWVADWYAPEAGIAPASGASHVLRGGGWLSPPGASRTTSRSWASAMEAGPNVGFRCARDAD